MIEAGLFAICLVSIGFLAWRLHLEAFGRDVICRRLDQLTRDQNELIQRVESLDDFRDKMNRFAGDTIKFYDRLKDLEESAPVIAGQQTDIATRLLALERAQADRTGPTPVRGIVASRRAAQEMGGIKDLM